MIWCLSAAHGRGPLLAAPATASTSSELGWGVKQQPYARKPGDQVMGQWISILGFGVIMPLFGCLTCSATQAI